MMVCTTEAERGKERKMEREELIEFVLNMTDEKAKELRKMLEERPISRPAYQPNPCRPA